MEKTTCQTIAVKNGTCKEAKKQSGRPRRPLSAYNLFFQRERQKIIAELERHGDYDGSNDGVGSDKTRARVGFANLASMISKRWKNVDPVYKKELERQAKVEKIKYKKDIDAWRKRKRIIATDLEEKDASVITDETDAANTITVRGQHFFPMGSMHNNWSIDEAPLDVAGSLNAASFNQNLYHSRSAVAYTKVDPPSVNHSEGHTLNNFYPQFGSMLGYNNTQSPPFPGQRSNGLPEIGLATMRGTQHSRSKSLFPCIQNDAEHENIIAAANELPIEEIQRFFGIDPERNRIVRDRDLH